MLPFRTAGVSRALFVFTLTPRHTQKCHPERRVGRLCFSSRRLGRPTRSRRISA